MTVLDEARRFEKENRPRQIIGNSNSFRVIEYTLEIMCMHRWVQLWRSIAPSKSNSWSISSSPGSFVRRRQDSSNSSPFILEWFDTSTSISTSMRFVVSSVPAGTYYIFSSCKKKKEKKKSHNACDDRRVTFSLIIPLY